MKYAFMTFSNPAWTLTETLAAAKRHGYDGVELRIGSDHEHGLELSSDAAQRSAAKQQAHDAGIAICCIATGCTFADPSKAAQSVEQARAVIDLAFDVGAQVIRVFGGKIPDGFSREQVAASIVASLRALAGKAEARGINIAIETHDDWCDPHLGAGRRAPAA